MHAIDFPIRKHLTTSDQARLEELAKESGQTSEDLIETLIKRALFASPAPAKKPRRRRTA